MRIPSAILLVALILSAHACATDLLVGPPGSGAPYTSVQAAIDASQPGDRVILLPGTHLGPVFVDKGIELLGAGIGMTVVLVVSNVAIPPAIEIANLPAGARLRVSGIGFGVFGGGAITPHLMWIHDCAGRIELCDVDVAGSTLQAFPATIPAGLIHVHDCAQVVASGVRAIGQVSAFPFPHPGGPVQANGLAGALIEESSVWMMDCAINGNATRPPSSGFGGDGGDGIRAIDSTLYLGGTSAAGSQSGGRQNGVPGFGGAGLRAIGSTILVHGGSGNAIYGAHAFEFAGSGTVGVGFAGNAVVLDSSSSLTYAPDVNLIPGAASASLPGGVPIAASSGASVIPTAERLPTVSITPAFVPLGSMLTIEIAGQPGFDHIRVAALQTAPAVTFPGALGALVIDLQAVFLTEVQTLGPTGVATSSVTVPADPSLAGIQVVEQAAQVLPGGIAISPPVIVSLGF